MLSVERPPPQPTKVQAATPLQPQLIQGYVDATGDPEVSLSSWITDGRPLGIRSEHLPSGIFPAVSECEAPVREAESLPTDLATFSNYGSFKEWPEPAREQVPRLHREGFVRKFDSFEVAPAFPGEPPRWR